ncbi:hypothetical protein [Bradyrhizobium sp. LB11.1]|uniref:hypothetical protein n=1 Tax=Bradyrhizobium sp. LB11.1 TaxID=3156326 RepID=UPI00339A9120
MNLRIDFWKNPQHWPRDSSTHIFLARALSALGTHLFPAEWTGDETSIELMPAIPETRDASSDFRIHRVLNPLSFPDKPTRNARAGGFAGGPPPKATENEWHLARAIVERDHAEKLPALRRLSEVQEKFISWAESGKLITAARPRAGGAIVDLPAWAWNAEGLTRRFQLCQINPEDPFSPASGGDRFWWIFIDRRSLSAAFGSTPIKQTANLQTQCSRWLGQQFKEPNTADWNKEAFRKAATEKFGSGLGVRAFQRAWDDATSKPGNEKRKSAGRKTRN